MFKGWQNLCFWWLETLFWSFWVENWCFWKTLKLILMHFIHEIIWIEWFLHNLLQFFKKFKFLEFPPIECVFRPIKNPLIFNHCSLPNSIGIHSMLDQSKLKNFQFLSFWPIFFFMHHLCLGFTYIALFSVSILHFCNHMSHHFHT